MKDNNQSVEAAKIIWDETICEVCKRKEQKCDVQL